MALGMTRALRIIAKHRMIALYSLAGLLLSAVVVFAIAHWCGALWNQVCALVDPLVPFVLVVLSVDLLLEAVWKEPVSALILVVLLIATNPERRKVVGELESRNLPPSMASMLESQEVIYNNYILCSTLAVPFRAEGETREDKQIVAVGVAGKAFVLLNSRN